MEVSDRGTRASVLDPANRGNEAVRKGEPLVARPRLPQGWTCQLVEMPLSTYRTLFSLWHLAEEVLGALTSVPSMRTASLAPCGGEPCRGLQDWRRS